MYRCSVLLQLFNVAPTSYASVYILSFIWKWHMPIKSLILPERKIRIYFRTRTTTTVETLTTVSVSIRFKAYPIYPQQLSFLLFVGCQMRFFWSVIMTTSICLQAISGKCRMLHYNTRFSFMFWSFGSPAIVLLFQILSPCWFMYT